MPQGSSVVVPQSPQATVAMWTSQPARRQPDQRPGAEELGVVGMGHQGQDAAMFAGNAGGVAHVFPQDGVHVLLVRLDAGLAVGIDADQPALDHRGQHQHLEQLPERALVEPRQADGGRAAQSPSA